MEIHYVDAEPLPIPLVRVLERITYKPGWRLFVRFIRPLQVQNVLASPAIDISDPPFVVIHPSILVNNVNTGEATYLYGNGVRIDNRMNEREIVTRIFDGIQDTEAHECAEQFNYNGIRVFDPHISYNGRDQLMKKAFDGVDHDPMNLQNYHPLEFLNLITSPKRNE